MLRIHIVNSIKGGCGKSTICLHLADYLNQQGLSPIIVDVDLCGTSWYNNYEYCLDETFKKENYHFINDLIDNFDECIKGHYIASIKTNILKDKSVTDIDNPGKDIKICMADPDRNTQIEEVELDLFENSIYKLIMKLYAEKGRSIITDKSSESKEEKIIDIILDMPPGYEAHAERIINHLLLDVNSPLYRKIKKDKIEYKILLYMITGLNISCIEHNIGYIKKLFLNQSISEDAYNCLKKDNIYFIINDCANVMAYVKDTQNLSSAKDEFDKEIIDRLKDINSVCNTGVSDNNAENNNIGNIIKTETLANIEIASNVNMISTFKEKKTIKLNISNYERTEFAKIFKTFNLSVAKDNNDKKAGEKDEESTVL